jgi:sulfide:quinone oxidoreductase
VALNGSGAVAIDGSAYNRGERKMAGTTTLILGGGWGGLTLAHRLAGLTSDDQRILVVERDEHFVLGVSNLGVLTGERTSPDVSRHMSKLKSDRIQWVHAEVDSIDPVAKSADTTAGNYDADYLVVALGAELAPAAVPGFAESAHNLYEAGGAAAAHAELERVDEGKIVVLIAGAPFRCPAAPYETSMLVESTLRANGVRDRVEIDLYTPEGIPMAVAGPAVGEALCGFLAGKGIGAHFNHQVTSIDGEERVISFDDEQVPYDLLIGIPPHRGPAAAAKAGLTDASGYVPVHPQTLELLTDPDTLEVGYPGVYAIGDATAVRLMNAMLLPKAGVFAEGQAEVVAAAIAADIAGESRPRGYDGHGFCYVDVGDGLAAYGSGDFYAYPGPRVKLEGPTAEARQAKDEYEAVLDNWFDR